MLHSFLTPVKTPKKDHIDYMTETLPMLEEHPFVARYAWMSALTDTDVMLNNKTTFELNELGELYNQYVWDKSSYHNQQWTFRQPAPSGKTFSIGEN